METSATRGARESVRIAIATALFALLASIAGATAGAGVSSVPALAPPENEDDAAAVATFERTDTNHDGQLSLDEFKAGVSASRLGVIYQRLPSKFRSADADQSGFLEADEFAALPIIRSAGSEAPTLASADGDHNAKLDFREYVAMMAQLDGATP
jgi:hypothetical protein